MIFTTFWFLFFVVAFCIIYWAFPSRLGRSLLLAAANVVFYVHFAGLASLAPIVILALIAFLCGRAKRNIYIYVGLGLSICTLLFYKYTAFVMHNLAHAIPSLQSYSPARLVPVVVPLGISFFVFEFVHYLADVKAGSKPIENPLDFLNFGMFFPTLVAGPIKRYEQFLPALNKSLSAKMAAAGDLQQGLLRIASGFAKKFVADNISFYLAAVVPSFSSQTLLTRWIIFAGIAFRVYFDFSGYSDMAIGVARMMGIVVPENFRWPYISTNITEFWRRWHISLSTWIRDYLFYPLGGNWTGGKIRQSFNLLLAFTLCGLWHGAAWNFVLWGLYHGIGMIAHRLFTSIPWPWRTVRIWTATEVRLSLIAIKWALTTFFVWAGWLLFFYPPRQALALLVGLFNE